MPRAVKHAAPRAAEHAAPRDRSAEHAAARTLDALPTFVGKPFVPLEAELKNPKRLDETERRLDAWLKRQEREHHNPNRTRTHGAGFIRFAPTAGCGGGFGMMLSYVRTLLFYAFATNLTYVHTPLTLSHHVDGKSMDYLLGFDVDEHIASRPFGLRCSTATPTASWAPPISSSGSARCRRRFSRSSSG